MINMNALFGYACVYSTETPDVPVKGALVVKGFDRILCGSPVVHERHIVERMWLSLQNELSKNEDSFKRLAQLSGAFSVAMASDPIEDLYWQHRLDGSTAAEAMDSLAKQDDNFVIEQFDNLTIELDAREEPAGMLDQNAEAAQDKKKTGGKGNR